MIVFILTLILCAILYSTERGRLLLYRFFKIPFVLLALSFTSIAKIRDLYTHNRAKKFVNDNQIAIRQRLNQALTPSELSAIDLEWTELTLTPNGVDSVIAEAKLFHSIQEGGQDPRILNIEEHFRHIKADVYKRVQNKFNEQSKDFAPRIMHHLYDYFESSKTYEISNYEEIKVHLGVVAVMGKHTASRLKTTLRACTRLSDSQIADTIKYIFYKMKVTDLI